jgi:hypothetical protein
MIWILAASGLLGWIILALITSNAVWAAFGGSVRTATAADDETDDSKLTRRLRNPQLFMKYLTWKAAKVGAMPPSLADFQWKGQPEGENTFTVAVEKTVDSPPNFRYTQVGSALEVKLGRKINGLLTSDVILQNHEVLLGSLEGAYRHCVHTLAPSYEYADYEFGDGLPVTFERLILPLSDATGQITHLMGIVLLDDQCWQKQGSV